MRLRTLWPAAVVTAAVAAPVSLALAAATPAPGTSVVSPSLRGAGAGPSAREHLRLSRHYDALTGRHTARAAERRALRPQPARLRERNRELRGEVRELDIPIPAVLKKVAECESHGDPKAIGGGGAFRGRYQFMVSTWHSVGGKGDPVAAPAEEQDRRAAILMARSGSSPWPVCGGR